MSVELPEAPSACARCGAPTVVPIVYGMPAAEVEQAARDGLVELGGCMVPQPQRWSCHACGYRWPLPGEVLESDLVRKAFGLAAAAHRDSGGLEHTVHVAHMLWEEGYGEQIVVAGLLHDVVEHACIGFRELESQFGHEIAELVDVLTEHEQIRDFEKRKLVHRARVTTGGRRPAVIYAADKLACLRDLRASYAREGECIARRRDASLDEMLVNAERDIRMLGRADPPLPFVAELKEQVSGLRADRTAARRKRRTAICRA